MPPGDLNWLAFEQNVKQIVMYLFGIKKHFWKTENQVSVKVYEVFSYVPMDLVVNHTN